MKIILLDAVEDFLKSTLIEKEIAKTIRVIELLEEFGNKLSMPHSKPLEEGLFELRIRGKREIRIIYCFYQNNGILLHAFIKKTKNVQAKELAKAKRVKFNLHNYNL